MEALFSKKYQFFVNWTTVKDKRVPTDAFLKVEHHGLEYCKAFEMTRHPGLYSAHFDLLDYHIALQVSWDGEWRKELFIVNKQDPDYYALYTDHIPYKITFSDGDNFY